MNETKTRRCIPHQLYLLSAPSPSPPTNIRYFLTRTKKDYTKSKINYLFLLKYIQSFVTHHNFIVTSKRLVKISCFDGSINSLLINHLMELYRPLKIMPLYCLGNLLS